MPCQGSCKNTYWHGKINVLRKRTRIYWTDYHQIFIIWSYLIVDFRFGPLFLMAQGPLPWQPILGSQLAKSVYSPLFVALAFRNGLQYRHSDFKQFSSSAII